MNQSDKTNIQVEREIANKLKSMCKVGETYSDIIRKLLEDYDAENMETHT